jgi:hypothetical protein
MSDLKITGNITKVLELQKGTSKAGKEWQKQNFLVQTDAAYNNYYFFEVFGEDKIEKFFKWNKVGSKVTVSFNVKTNEHNGKYYTTLVAWNIFNEFTDAPTETEKIGVKPVLENEEETEDDLPF